jgi:hypothetical protein
MITTRVVYWKLAEHGLGGILMIHIWLRLNRCPNRRCLVSVHSSKSLYICKIILSCGTLLHEYLNLLAPELGPVRQNRFGPVELVGQAGFRRFLPVQWISRFTCTPPQGLLKNDLHNFLDTILFLVKYVHGKSKLFYPNNRIVSKTISIFSQFL